MSARLAAYLARLGLAAPPAPTPEGLAQLQAAHRRAIPFENLDVLLRRRIHIDSDAVFAKLVGARRGGYCFEMNRLFADMLGELGIATRPLLARPRLAMPDDARPPRTHVLLLAEFAGQAWIADAGFGGSFAPPLPLVDGAMAQTADGARHRLRRIDRADGEWLLERAGPRASTDGRARDHAGWQGQYTFDLAPVFADDLEQANHWTATWPASRFLGGPIVSLVPEGGFLALTGTTLSRAQGGVTVERRELAGAAQWRDVLAGEFGIDLALADAARLAGG